MRYLSEFFWRHSWDVCALDMFRNLLPENYDDKVILQYLQFGFPLSLQADFMLKPVLKIQSSSYEFNSHVDKFVKTELKREE